MAHIAFMMADPYDWEQVRQQLAGHELEIWDDWRDLAAEALATRCRGVDAVVTGRRSPPLPASLLADRGRLRLLAHCHGTVKHLVDEEHLRSGLLVSNWGDNVFGVAESALGLLLACLKQLPALTAFIGRDWSDDERIHQSFPCSLAKAKVGLYGFGPIGRHMGRLLEPFGGPVAIHDPYAKEVPERFGIFSDLRKLFAWADVISIHCGLNDTTRDSVTGELLDLLPQGGILINTARGPIVDEEALTERVLTGRLLCGLDVLCNEKRWAQNPLNGHPGAILTGHVVTSGKGYPPGDHPPKVMPGFIRTNADALDGKADFVNLISAEEFALKT